MKYMALLLLFAVGCGDGLLVQQHTVTRAEMASSFGPDVRGHAVWDDFSCDIFVFIKSEYDSTAQYHEVLGHEYRHCVEGDWHDKHIPTP